MIWGRPTPVEVMEVVLIGESWECDRAGRSAHEGKDPRRGACPVSPAADRLRLDADPGIRLCRAAQRHPGVRGDANTLRAEAIRMWSAV